MNTSSSEDQSYPLEAGRVHNSGHPKDVENSIIQILYDVGSPNPQAFLRRWPLEDIIPALTEVKAIMRDDPTIKNPAGLLWRMMEDRSKSESQQTNGGK